MNLRPHHLLCIQKFTGHGYDDTFTEHMTSVLSALTVFPETSVTLTDGCDALCAKCPHNRDNTCASSEKTARMDADVLAAAGLSGGTTAPWSSLARIARDKIFKTQKDRDICCRCQWFDLCQRTPLPFSANSMIQNRLHREDSHD